MRLRRAGAARSNVQNTIAAVLVVLTTLSCAATYAAFNQFPPFGDDPDAVLWLLTLDSILLLALLVLIARRVVSLWANRKQGEAGSHLHVRLVYIFSVMAAVPAIIMTVFSVFFFNYGIQAWFSERVQTAVLESQEVAQAYLAEHKEVIRADTPITLAGLFAKSTYIMSCASDQTTGSVRAARPVVGLGPKATTPKSSNAKRPTSPTQRPISPTLPTV